MCWQCLWDFFVDFSLQQKFLRMCQIYSDLIFPLNHVLGKETTMGMSFGFNMFTPLHAKVDQYSGGVNRFRSSANQMVKQLAVIHNSTPETSTASVEPTNSHVHHRDGKAGWCSCVIPVHSWMGWTVDPHARNIYLDYFMCIALHGLYTRYTWYICWKYRAAVQMLPASSQGGTRVDSFILAHSKCVQVVHIRFTWILTGLRKGLESASNLCWLEIAVRYLICKHCTWTWPARTLTWVTKIVSAPRPCLLAKVHVQGC